jgi:hypothetical protein
MSEQKVSSAVSRFTRNASSAMAANPSAAAKASASRSVSAPLGSGRARVRAICSSMRRSSTWLMVAAQAAASAMPRLPHTSAANGGTPGLASSVPTTAVKVMSATTLGFVSSR